MTKNHPPKNKRNRFQAPKINIKLETTKRIVIFSIATLLIGTAQCSFFPMLDICPRTPDLIMALILATALCDNAKSAMILAIGAGFFIDAIGATSFALSPMIYFIYAVIIGAVSQKFLKSFPSFALLLLPSLLYRALATTIMFFLTNGALSGGLFVTLLLEAICTFVVGLAIYPLINLATKPLSSHKKFSF
jgi:hypothetical protein